MDEAAKKRGWSREWPDHGDETDDTGGAGHIAGKRGGVMMMKTSQELRMLSSVTINCQITKIVMNSGSQLSEL